MDELDCLYARLMQVGLLVLDQALEAGDTEWARAEVQLLHNVPSLLGEENVARHAYFWKEERTLYLDWMNAHGSEHAHSRMRTYYEPIWDELKVLIAKRAAAAMRRSQSSRSA